MAVPVKLESLGAISSLTGNSIVKNVMGFLLEKEEGCSFVQSKTFANLTFSDDTGKVPSETCEFARILFTLFMNTFVPFPACHEDFHEGPQHRSRFLEQSAT
jgi:hypothetical protein